MKGASALAIFSNFSFVSTLFPMTNSLKDIRIARTDSNFKREKLRNPLGFKGGYLTELWQTAVKLESESGKYGIGIATQSVLYGEAELFSTHSEAGGNALMFALTDKALQLIKQTTFTTPIELLDKILPQVIQEGKRITGKQDLNETFVYNAMVSVDNAAWLLYAAENKVDNFSSMVPPAYRKALSYQNDKIAIMFSVSYSMPIEDLIKGKEDGYFIYKIKTGAPGTQAEMVEQDIARLTEIHNVLKDATTDQTKDGKVIYTIDANARYEKKETLIKYLDHARKIGAYDQILLVEEPLNTKNDENVSDIGVRIVADESIHDEASALRRLDQGYGGFVLKGIAKTLSLSMKMAKLAYERDIPCLCADLTVNPILLDWHKNLAGRLMPFPGLGMGLMETNGASNYLDWEAMKQNHPAYGAPWTKIKNGVFELNNGFYEASGGIYQSAPHYEEMFENG